MVTLFTARRALIRQQQKRDNGIKYWKTVATVNGFYITLNDDSNLPENIKLHT